MRVEKASQSSKGSEVGGGDCSRNPAERGDFEDSWFEDLTFQEKEATDITSQCTIVRRSQPNRRAIQRSGYFRVGKRKSIGVVEGHG